MNNNIIRKCIDELKKDSPSIPYVLGMLETLSEMTSPAVSVVSQSPLVQFTPSTNGVLTTTTDEAAIMDAAAKAKLNEVMKNVKYE